MNRSRVPIVVVMLISLIGAGITRQWAAAERYSGRGSLPQASGASNLSQMNSYALALLLGGLRGPLVMFLWPSAEEQKSEKNLEDFDTKIEWIRLLQAEFDSVHIFQIWNKAWNVSVQMASLANKYRTILDAIDYGKSVDRERPNNINIISAIARVYGEKLGNSDEKAYYRQRVRDESKARTDMVRATLPATRRAEFGAAVAAAGESQSRLRFSEEQAGGRVSVTIPKSLASLIREKFSGPDVSYIDRAHLTMSRSTSGAQRTEMDPILDEQGRILQSFLTPTSPRPSNLDPQSEWNDGSELQYLKQYEPFPYGVSAIALGYNYYKRAQVLATVNHQSGEQTMEVVSSRPAVALRIWADEEWERARRAEVEALRKAIPESRNDLEQASADVPLNTPLIKTPLLEEALYGYGRTAQLAQDSIREYYRHFGISKLNLPVYLVTIDDLEAETELVRGDLDYLKAMLEPAGERKELTHSATEHYQHAIQRYELILLQYYTPDDVAQKFFPPGMTRANLGQKFKDRVLTEPALAELFSTVMAALPRDLQSVDNRDFMLTYLQYLSRGNTRLMLLK